MNKIIYTYCCLLFAVVVFANTVSPADSAFIRSQISKSESFEQVNIDSAFYYAETAYKLAQGVNSVFLKCRSSLRLGIVYQNMSDYKKAAVHFKEGITLAEKGTNKELLAQAYNGFANLFALQKQFDQAAEYFNKALLVSKEINDVRKVSVILMNLANIEYSNAYYSGDFTKCYKMYQEAYDWAVTAKDTGQQISCLGNLGLAYSDDSKFDLSIEKLSEAIRLATAVKNNSDLIFLNHYLGRTYGLMKQHDKAIHQFSESLKLAFEFKDVDYQSENYYCLAESNYELGNYKEAYDYFEKYKTTEDTLSSLELKSELNSIKAKYDDEKKQKEIELLKAKANQDKIVKWALMAGAVLLLLLAFLMYNRYRLKEKTNKLLEHQNEIISEKNKDISDSINYAKKIQEAILPHHAEIEKVFPDSFILSMPKDIVSGDFYWFTQYDYLKIFVVADCTGHGVPGAFMSMIGNTLLNNIVVERKIMRPDLVLNELRNEIIKALKQGEGSESKDGMDLSIICLNTQTNVLQTAGANNPVWVLKNDGSLLEIKADKQPIGFTGQPTQEFSLNSLELAKGDVIYQFSDGYADQFGGEKGKKFKYNQLKELIIANRQLPLKEQGLIFKTAFETWKGNLMQIDDVLVTGIKV